MVLVASRLQFSKAQCQTLSVVWTGSHGKVMHNPPKPGRQKAEPQHSLTKVFALFCPWLSSPAWTHLNIKQEHSYRRMLSQLKAPCWPKCLYLPSFAQTTFKKQILCLCFVLAFFFFFFFPFNDLNLGCCVVFSQHMCKDSWFHASIRIVTVIVH